MTELNFSINNAGMIFVLKSNVLANGFMANVVAQRSLKL